MTTAEAIWYAMYSDDGERPRCDRLSRMTPREQLGMGAALLIQRGLPNDLMWLGDYERCIGWAWVRRRRAANA